MQNLFVDAADPTGQATGPVDGSDADGGGHTPAPTSPGHTTSEQTRTVPVPGTGLVLCVGLDPDQWSSIIRSVNADTAVMVVANAESALRVLAPGGVLPEQSPGRRPHLGHDPYDGHDGYEGRPAPRPLTLGPAHGREPSRERDSEPRTTASGVVEFGPLRLDHDLREAFWHTRPIELSARQFDLLATLAGAGNRVWTFAELTETVWRRPYVGDVDAVASAVKRLRRRLQGVTSELAVASVRGVGYRIALVPTTLPVRSDVPAPAW
ncbi:winged helix-turn-helix domain-containing protein [Actinopolymorpha sp. NPDC004070]|uniref:winged helix-turn-helix domain-containing protein n=1 Tax=Actinopolymorpha sp. NPDC004070 TaxID=3154548 RepID=UPI0033AB0112